MVPVSERPPSRRALSVAPGEFVAAAGVAVHYVRRGTGRPVVFIHGAKSSVWDFLLSIGDGVAERYTAVAFDRPGAGYSQPLDHGGEHAPQAQARVLRAAAAELELERPILVGHSFGAAVALAWALEAQEEVSAVVTLAGHVMPPGEAPTWLTSLVRSPVTLRTLSLVARTPFARPLVARALERIFAPEPVPPDYVRVAPAIALEPARLLNDGRERARWTPGLRALESSYPELGLPVVVVVGAQDHVVPASSSLRLHRLLPASELVVLPASGHMPHFTQPETVLAAIDRAAELSGP